MADFSFKFVDLVIELGQVISGGFLELTAFGCLRDFPSVFLLLCFFLYFLKPGNLGLELGFSR